MSDGSEKASVSSSPLYRAYVLFILVVVYAFNFIDRQIVGILAVPIKADLGLSDTQLSLMGGLAFALFYTFLGIPIAMLADRASRTWIMTAALAIWSAMTAACGFAQNFLQLFLARLGVGVGEAGGVAPAYSLISDYFPAEKRARALSIYSFGIPVGSALGILLGGVLTTYLGWRSAFIIVGLAGLAIAPIFRLTMREPKRGGLDGATAVTTPAKVSDVAMTLARKPSFWGLSFGAASSSMMGYGLIFWLPSFFVRSYGDALPGFFAWMPDFLIPANPSALLYASYFYATILLLGGVAGIWLGGVTADKYGQERKGAYAMVPALAFITTIPFFIIGVLAPSLWIAFPAFLVLQALSLVWLGPVLSAFQHLVQPNMRATASALFLFINNLIGIGLGNLAIGAISDHLSAQYGDESLRYAILSGIVFYVIAAGLFIATAPRLKRDWAA
ncbi:spinster family MFS transporter [Hyphococcus sp.]|uniref:spinster family MFS transporter n=1 Tax=Hyphococcus sp. TaxID=2038636 RepID=UPI0035C763AC